ncbi:MAG TPA: hypothetical protein IAC41_10470 [Candidatus Merdenecus merdavium]|nr:hypothetical protein [Candidatus Merdenecus merdavium]
MDTVNKELTALRWLSIFLVDKHQEIESCQDMDREFMEDQGGYLILISTHNPEHALYRL